MHGVILAGAPGAGKTTLLAELARRGFATVQDSAREVIAERLARGDSPRPDPSTFARELLRRDHGKYAASADCAGLVFFDRSVLESLAMVHECRPLPETELRAEVASYHFHGTVFLLPPWARIYRTDAERDQTFAHAERVHLQLIAWYRWCGFTLDRVPPDGVTKRADYVLRALAAGEA